MYRAFAKIAQSRGATHLGSYQPTIDALKSRTRTFGQDRMKYYDEVEDESNEEWVSMEKEIPAEEAWRRAEIQDSFNKYLEYLDTKYDRKPGERFDAYATKEESDKLAMLGEAMKQSRGYNAVVDLRGLDMSEWATDVPVEELPA